MKVSFFRAGSLDFHLIVFVVSKNIFYNVFLKDELVIAGGNHTHYNSKLFCDLKLWLVEKKC